MKNFIMTILTMLGLVSTSSCNEHKSVETVSVQEFQQRLCKDSTALLLDVRKPEEFTEGHLNGAMLINWLDRQAFETETAEFDTKRTLYVYCRSGRRSYEAANYLADLGFKVVDMQGGYLAWIAAGLPTE